MAIIIQKQRLLAEYPTCYACDDKKTSYEHAPPLCFFPDQKGETGNCRYRKNLIRVPSCDTHNLKKSDDDIYAAWHVAGLDGTNHCAPLVSGGSLQRSIDRDRSGAFAMLLREEIYEVGENFAAGKADGPRMIRFFRQCAQAIYFYARMKPLKLPLRVATLSNDFRDEANAARLRGIETSFAAEMSGCQWRGENPEVFQYAICEKPELNVLIIGMLFYESAKYWAFYHPEAPRQHA